MRALRSIYQLKIKLLGTKPPIWRRLQVVSTANLEDLHIALQIVMGWSNSHMHMFAFGQHHYGVPDEQYTFNIKDQAKFRLDQLLKREKETFSYLYDLGDSWEHEVVLEKILPFETDAVLPVCLKASRACPPEDVGGIPGYEMFLEAVLDPSHPEHEDMLEWCGGEFDPDFFDVVEANMLLREYL